MTMMKMTSVLRVAVRANGVAQRTMTPGLRTMRSFSTASEDDKSVFTQGFLNGVSEDQAKKALERSDEIRAKHVAAKDSYPSQSQGETEISADEANRKRIIYRSKQRGWLEVDLLLGSWAAQNVMGLTAEELKQYEDILNQETIDIFNYISGKDVIPEEINTPIMKRIQEYCFSSPLGQASVEGFAANKKYMSN
ncbi:hypothetical protein Poli38472_001825 [Pythium oligandrum]|uniref:Succinate dehydrogenase assembly factor 2, mitochondrial n=1 Tax=Pythium oligandrum TaxID=41045 RepID=A0A8K1CUB1_PYTOL|nr:hypothetical protein Poli38472_001825 [Pythium oligandrum]|eukprot:TMW69669.1 hypothetical protein Poli38472_001825 [Pythium oligandrum]